MAVKVRANVFLRASLTDALESLQFHRIDDDIIRIEEAVEYHGLSQSEGVNITLQLSSSSIPEVVTFLLERNFKINYVEKVANE